MPQNEQTSLEKAFLDFKSLKDTAKAELMNQLEEKVEERILSLMNEEIQEDVPLEDKEIVSEGVTVTINVDGDDVSVDAGSDEDLETVTAPEEDADEMFEISDDAESYQIKNEMNYLDEQEPLAPEMGAAPEAAPAPAPAPAPEAVPEPEMGEGQPEDQIISGIKALIAQSGGELGADPAAGGEIDIVDDAPEAAMAPPVAEEFDMEEIFEIIDEMDAEDDEYLGMDGRFGAKDRVGPNDDDITMDDIMEDEDELYEIALDLDEEEDELDEVKMMGHSHSVQRSTGTSAGPEVAVKNRSRKAAVKESTSQKGNKNTAHNEANIAELNKENESLKAKVNEQKGEIKKFHQSFVELRSQFNEMQTFNAKLAYANKLFANGGFSEKEKLQIAESFDKAANADDAKKLYNSIISENKLTVKDIKSEISATPSRAARPQNQSEHVVLHESAEMKRMKKLAGISRRES